MFYKPKFCCQCGEPIERANWKLFASRRFCELCETDYKFEDLIPKIIVGAGILFGIIGLGSFLHKAEKPLNLASNSFTGNSANTNKSVAGAQLSSSANNQAVVQNRETNTAVGQSTEKPPTVVPKPNLKVRKVENSSNQAPETIYFCGAETKKGTLCTHLVKGGGRCWQHAGKPAMLAPEKLIASR